MVSCVLVKLSESTLLFSSSGELSIGRTHIIQINELTRITTAISWPSLFSGLDYWTGLLDWTTGLNYWTHGNYLWRRKEQDYTEIQHRHTGKTWLFSITPIFSPSITTP